MAMFAGGWATLMPLMIFICDECNTKVERIQRHKRRRINPLCHICGKKMKWIKFPGSNFELKGGGWTK